MTAGGRVQPYLRTARRMLAHPTATLRLVKALGAGGGPQVGRQLRLIGGDGFVRDLVSSALYDDDVLEVAFVRDGMVWRSDLGDEVGRQLFRDGRYEGEEIDAVLAWLRRAGRSGVVLDVGANIGTTTVPFARAGFRVVAVEPVPGTHELLVANVEASGMADRVDTVPVAVTAERGEVEMWVGFGSGRSEVSVGGEAPEGMVAKGDRGTVVVPSAPLGDVLDDLDVDAADVALVWADVQGCEADVIGTAPALWAAGVPLWLEVDPTRLERQTGLVAFLGAVAEHFGAFVPRAEMLAGGSERPIAGFATWVGEIPPGRYEDALLLPGP